MAALSVTDRAAWHRLRAEIEAGVPIDAIAQSFRVTPADLMEWIFAYKESAEDRALYAAERRTARRAKLQSFAAIADMDDTTLRDLRDSADTHIAVETERKRRIDLELGRRAEIEVPGSLRRSGAARSLGAKESEVHT